MEKLQLLQSITELVLDAEKRLPEGNSIDVNYSGHVQGICVNYWNETPDSKFTRLASKTHYIGQTYGDSIEDITAWLQTL